MLVARKCDPGRNFWLSSKREALYSCESSRMPEVDPLSARPGWQENYSTFSLVEDQNLPTNDLGQSESRSGSFISHNQDVSKPVLEQQTGMRRHNQTAQPREMPHRISWNTGEQASSSSPSDPSRSLISSELAAISQNSIGMNTFHPIPGTQIESANVTNDEDGAGTENKDEEEELEEDDEMVDGELEEGSNTKTDAQKRAERRKMKRFRLTHQQTRFLMSEFAKEAHPDAAHRERLSREIPGLSPRQVQVWFQNRRAKIKRLTADDRERMIKMRAMPENFDNLKALHSPYGAVHGLGSPMRPPEEFVAPYSEQLIPPLIVEPAGTNREDQITPTSSSPAFSHVAFGTNSSLRSPDFLSAPTSLDSPDPYYSTRISSPISTLQRGALSFNRQTNVLPPSPACPPQHILRLAQPAQFCDNISKARPDSLQSPMRLSMSWKVESLNYGDYQTGQPKPQFCRQQQPSMDQSEYLSSYEIDSQQYETNPYSGASNIANSPSNIFPSPSSASSFLEHPGLLSMSRIGTSSPAPPGFSASLEFRNQYQGRNSSPITTPQSGSFVGAFTATGYVCQNPNNFATPLKEYVSVNSHRLSPIGSDQGSDGKIFNTDSGEQTHGRSPEQDREDE